MTPAVWAIPGLFALGILDQRLCQRGNLGLQGSGVEMVSAAGTSTDAETWAKRVFLVRYKKARFSRFSVVRHGSDATV